MLGGLVRLGPVPELVNTPHDTPFKSFLEGVWHDLGKIPLRRYGTVFLPDH